MRNAFAFALAAAAMLAAEARVVYMTPSGAGAMDGTSWENAWKGSDLASFKAAYTNAAEGATADAPNEIWLKYGEYSFSNGELYNNDGMAIQIQPNVVLRGGFLGAETSADAADPKANPTVLGNSRFDVNETWNDGTKIWTRTDGRLAFTDPPADGGWSNMSQGFQSAFSQTNTTAALGVVEFHGLTFTKFWSTAIWISSPNDRPIVVRNCRFLNMGRLTNSYHFMVDLTDVGLDMDGCEFVAGYNPIMVRTTATNSTHRTASIKNSRFFATAGCWNSQGQGGTSGGVLALNNVALTIKNCTFDSIKSGGEKDNAAAVLSVKTMADVSIEDTVIGNSLGTSRFSGGAFSYYSQGDGALTVRRSRFENNCYQGAKEAHHTQAAAVTFWGDLANGRTPRATFEDVAFVGNWTSNTVAGCESASCVAFGSNNYGENGYWKANFVNCLFERNESFNSWTNGTAGATFCYSWTQNPRPVFVNCVFKDNLCSKFAEDYTRTVSPEIGSHGNSLRDAFVNTVFENTTATAIPWASSEAQYVSLASVVTDADVPMTTTRSDRYRYAPSVANATIGFENDLYTNGVVVARRLSNQSAYRKKGCPVWAGTDGEYYLYDADGDSAKPWRSCRYGGARLTDAEALAVGVSQAAAPLADAFGTARKATRCALGQLELPAQGMLLIVR